MITLMYSTSYQMRTCWVEVLSLLNEEPHYVTALATAYGARTCSPHVISLVTEELQNVLY